MANYTDAQKAAYNAGRGYAAAKAGKRISVKDENKASFRAGLKRGKTQACACKKPTKQKKK